MRVRVFSTKTCAPCKLVYYWLDKEKIAYEKIDCTEDSKLADPAVAISHQTQYPQIMLNDDIVIVGANIPLLKKRLQK